MYAPGEGLTFTDVGDAAIALLDERAVSDSYLLKSLSQWGDVAARVGGEHEFGSPCGDEMGRVALNGRVGVFVEVDVPGAGPAKAVEAVWGRTHRTLAVYR